MKLKNRLKELRARDGLNQSRLARIVGFRQSTAVSWREGNTPSSGHHHRPGFKRPVEEMS